MIVRDMVDHEVCHQSDSFFTQFGSERFQRVYVSDAGIHFTIVRYGVTSVVLSRTGLQERHEMEIGNSQFAQIVDV